MSQFIQKKTGTRFFFEDILVSDRIINRIQYKLVLEKNYNYALQLVSYKNCIDIYCTYICFKGYVLLMNLSLKLIGVIFKKYLHF